MRAGSSRSDTERTRGQEIGHARHGTLGLKVIASEQFISYKQIEKIECLTGNVLRDRSVPRGKRGNFAKEYMIRLAIETFLSLGIRRKNRYGRARL